MVWVWFAQFRAYVKNMFNGVQAARQSALGAQRNAVAAYKADDRQVVERFDVRL